LDRAGDDAGSVLVVGESVRVGGGPGDEPGDAGEQANPQTAGFLGPLRAGQASVGTEVSRSRRAIDFSQIWFCVASRR
jgi:hypothetical protein